MTGFGVLSVSSLGLGVVSLFLEQSDMVAEWVRLFTAIVDYLVLALTLTEVILGAARAPVFRNYVKQNGPSLLFVAAFIGLFIYNKASAAGGTSSAGYLTVLIIRNLFLLLKVFTRVRKLSEFVTRVVSHPAQTIVLSFLLVIAVGTLVMMMPFTTNDGRGLGFLDSLFTTTSAVCVTGLIVVDTATVLTVWGQAVVAVLIQIGGLGIMILSFFTVFVFRQSVSVERKLLLSYLLSESNLSRLSVAVRRIILITFGIEIGGALLLLPIFAATEGPGRAAFFAVFHAISAFCNAGFALFSDSLEMFVARPAFNVIVGMLIIAGGLSFAVITNLVSSVRSHLRRSLGRSTRRERLSVNSRAVLAVTSVLLVVGMLLFYGLEHGSSLVDHPTSVQYLAAFFQSVTLRTAGFNTISMRGLSTATYLVMVLWMFIGGASGSTAGGIKVNTIAVIGGYLRSLRRGRTQTLLFRHSVDQKQVASAFTVLLFGAVAVFFGTVVLSVTESFSLPETLFETVSAFATVGLSTGITGALSAAGRVVIIVLMFVGRVGPLTVFSAFAGKTDRVRISYPVADISVG